MRNNQPDREHRLLEDAAAIRRGAVNFTMRARLERRGALTGNQLAVLGQLHKFGTLTPSEIAERLGMKPQSLTRVLAFLEQARLVARAQDPSDHRQSILGLTRLGRTELRAETQPRDRWLAGVLDTQLTDSERALLVLASDLLERLASVDALGVPIVERVPEHPGLPDTDALRGESVGGDSAEGDSLERDPLGSDSLGDDSSGDDSLDRGSSDRGSSDRGSLDRGSLGPDSVGRDSLDRDFLDRAAAGHVADRASERAGHAERTGHTEHGAGR